MFKYSKNFQTILKRSVEFKNHNMEVLCNDVMRKYRFGSKNSIYYSFFVTDSGSLVIVDGDIGFGCFRGTLDILKGIFERKDGYQLEKRWVREIPNKEFSYHAAREYINEEINRYKNEDMDYSKLEDVLESIDYNSEHEILQDLYEIESDLPNLTDFNYNFCWCVVGLMEFFKKVEE